MRNEYSQTMGTYTSLAKLGTRRWETRTYRRFQRLYRDERPIEETRFLCPTCLEYFEFQDRCSRCKQLLIDRTRALPASVRRLPASRTALRSPAMLLLGVAALFIATAWIPFVEWQKGTMGMGSIVLFLTLSAAGAFGFPTAIAFLWRFLSRRRASSKLAHERAAMMQLELNSIAELPDEASEYVRIRGTVRFEVGPTKVWVHITDDSGAATLLPGSAIQILTAEGTPIELAAVHKGDEVDVVGTGRRRTVSSEETREEGQWEFCGEPPIFILVRSRQKASAPTVVDLPAH